MDNVILQMKDLNKSFTKNGKKFFAVHNVNLSIGKGECFGLIGESGSGKTTLANLIAGFIKADSGSISFLNHDLSGNTTLKVRKDMQMVFQDPTMSFSPKMKLIDGVIEGLKYYTNLSKNEQKEKAQSLLNIVGIPSDLWDRRCFEISGGQCQRAAIARAIAINPKLLICDEVTSALDVSIQCQIIDLLDKLRRELDMSYLFISHDLATVNSICDRVAVMFGGHIVEMGKTSEILTNPCHPYTKTLINSVLLVDAQTMNKKFDIEYQSQYKDYDNCLFAGKCILCNGECSGNEKIFISKSHWVKCNTNK